jgi:hypothetical protein
MTDERKDVVWLQQEVTRLFVDAAAQETPEHAVCVKYAELLYKLLPRDNGKVKLSDSLIEDIRKAMRDGK